jgi:integrase
VDKLRQLHHELDQGIVPKTGYANYTVRQAAQDWLANGLDGRSAKTVKKNQNVLEPILKVIGARKLRQLTAAEVRQALATMATRYSSAAVTMGHLALKRAIRHAEASDLVGRNVAALVDTPKGQHGRPSKSLTLAQAVAVITAAQTLPVMELRPGLKDVRRPAELMYAYIVLSLLVGVRTEEARALRWDHVNLDGDPHAAPRSPRTWHSGGRCATAARPRPNGPAAPSPFPTWPPRRSVRCATAKPTRRPWPGNDGRTPGWCSPPTAAPPWTRGTSGRCLSESV